MDKHAITTLQQAASQFSSGDLETAESLCRGIIQSYPKSVDANHLLALIFKNRRQAQQAEQQFRLCLELDSRRADIQANLGNLYKSLGRIEEARRQYLEALSCDSSFRQARLGLARTLCDMEDFLLAEKEALVLTNSDQADAEAWAVLAASRRGKRDFALAETAYQKALSLQPNYGVARQNFGALLTQLNRNTEALEQLELAAACGVAGSEININRASALLGLGRYQAAEDVLVILISTLPNNIDALELLAKIRYMRGEDDFARELAEACTKTPDNVGLQIIYARILQGADLLPAAETVLLDALKRSGPHAELYCALAAVQQLAGKHDASARHAQLAAVADGNNLRSIDLSIDALMSLGEVDNAKTLIAQARQRSPHNQWYIAMEATAARIAGEPLYEFLYDYDNFVQEFELEPPSGWDTIEQFNADLIEVLRHRHQFQTHPLDQSLRHGTQTPTSLLWDPDPVIKAFLSCLTKPIESYRNSIGHDRSHPLQARNEGEPEIIGCWSVRLHRGGYHVNHVHPQGWLSSAYYVETPPEIATTQDRAGWIQFGEPRFKIEGATAEKYVKPTTGKLVLFPSYMWHGTIPIQGDATRMTIAFDVVTRPDQLQA